MLVVCFAGIMAALCPLTCQAQSPQITSVSQISIQENQTIVIMGSGFGTSQPYTGNSPYIALWDTTKSWQAGFAGNVSGPSYCGPLGGNYDAVTLIVNSWEDSMITLGGFSGDWGGDGGNWTLSVGDVEHICVWNPQSGNGPATFSVTIGQQETVLHSFGNGTDGQNPYAGGLIFNAAGYLYGTTQLGGIHGLGTVFELSPNGSGGYTETVLHSFGNGTDGQYPYASLIFDGAGNLYGTTWVGGIHGYGTVFELSPREGGGYTETVLHSFGNPATQDGQNPYTGLIFDAAGNLYGTTYYGGIHGGGTVFELSPREGGGWTETVLHSFGNGTDGQNPVANLIFDGAGNLYGTTWVGGIHGYGTVFELSPREGGGYTETVLHSFGNGTDGSKPVAGMIFDGAGNLYGTTSYGGIHDTCPEGTCGTVFELSPRQGGGWTETVLHSFGNGTDGQNPYTGGLIFDAAGNLYGTTYGGGIYGEGTVFEMTPREGGGYTETVLHSFGNGTDGQSPEAGLIFDGAGNLYGTTLVGGIHGDGTVFEIMQPPLNGVALKQGEVLRNLMGQEDGSGVARRFLQNVAH